MTKGNKAGNDTGRPPKLSKTEKDKIEKLYKCQRAILEQDIQQELQAELDTGIEAHVQKIKELNKEAKAHEELITKYKKDHGFENMDRYGCFRMHPRIDEFRAETNNTLLKLWTGEIITL